MTSGPIEIGRKPQKPGLTMLRSHHGDPSHRTSLPPSCESATRRLEGFQRSKARGFTVSSACPCDRVNRRIRIHPEIPKQRPLALLAEDHPSV
jgi:hypothetical protein